MICSTKFSARKHFITQQFQLCLFVVVNADENHAVFAQQGFRQMQARQHHGEPVAVVMAAVFAVFAPRALEHAVALQVARVVGIAHAADVFFTAFGEFVGINKGTVAGVVGGPMKIIFTLPA
mgnify:CR=1 FL=1